MSRHDVVSLTRSNTRQVSVPDGSRLVATLEILTVLACLALGVAFAGSLVVHPPAPPDATTRVCHDGTAPPC